MDERRKMQTGKWIRKRYACALLAAALCMQGSLPVQAGQVLERVSEDAQASVSEGLGFAKMPGESQKEAGLANLQMEGKGRIAASNLQTEGKERIAASNLQTEEAEKIGSPNLQTEGAERVGTTNLPAEGEKECGFDKPPAEGRKETEDSNLSEGKGAGASGISAPASNVSGTSSSPSGGVGKGTPNVPADGKEAGTSNSPAEGREAGTADFSEESKQTGTTDFSEESKQTGTADGLADISNEPRESSQGTEAAGMPAEGLSLSKKSLTIKLGKSKRLTAHVKPAQAEQKVSWSSSNPKVAKVKNGKVTGVSVGKATITAKAGGKKATCKVKVTLKKKARKAIRAYQAYLGQKWIKWSDGSYRSRYQQPGIYSQDKFNFTLADMNADGVPELVLANTGSPAHYEGYQAVYCYSNGKVQELVRNDKIKCYYPRTGYVVAQYFGMGYHSFYYKIFKDGSTRQVGSEDTQVNGYSQTDYWFWDKKEVTRAEFCRLVREDAGVAPIELENGDFHKNTAENRKNMAKLYLPKK